MQKSDNVEKIDLDKIDWRSSREFFESLGEKLDRLDDNDESYNFTWVGKRKSKFEAGAPINKTLRPDLDASKDFDNTKNMLIIGDNLDALKLLQESYLGKIKMIYIDPPYNTGTNYIYRDNFTIKKADYEDATKDSSGNTIISEDEFSENSKANGRFHSDWLSMMYPRLMLARNLLTDDGLIFVSIDDSEQVNLIKLMDETFGEDQYVNTIVVKMSELSGLKMKHLIKFPKTKEYLIIYSKNKNNVDISIPKERKSADELSEYLRYYSNIIENPTDETTSWNIVPLKQYFETNNISPKDIDQWKIEHADQMVYRTNSVTISKYVANNPEAPNICELINNDGNTVVKWGDKEMLFLSKYIESYIGDLWLDISTINLNKEICLDDSYFEDGQKPLSLLRRAIESGSKDSDIILDFFAGSGSTGHAIMDINAEKLANRNYILVQLNEKTPDGSKAKKAGYDTIDQITVERLRRAGDKIIKEHPDLEGKLDTGFRVFRIDSENENTDIRKPLKDVSQTDLFNSIDNIKKDRSPLDLLFGVVYASALPFDLKLKTKKIDDNTVYLYGYLDEDSGLVACFDDSVSESAIKEIAKLKPLTAAFKDSSFPDSATKINLSEQFRVIAPDTKVKVI